MAKNKITKSPLSPQKQKEDTTRPNLEASTKTPIQKPELPIIWRILPFKNQLLPVFILFFIAVGLYVNSIPNNYALDDTIVLQVNTHVQEGFGGIKKILLREPFKNDFGNELLRKRYYRQLSIVTYAMEHAIFGGNPHVSHALNTLFYGISVIVIFLLLRDFFFRNKPEIAFISSFIFTVHPLHTEVVANIKSRDEIFCLLFCSLALYYAFKYIEAQNKNLNHILIAMLCYLLGLLSKENAIVFFAVFPLSFYFFSQQKRTLGQLAAISSPYLVVLIGYFMFRSGAIGINTAVEHTDMLHNRFMFSGFIEAFTTKVYILGIYLRMLVFPHPLIWDYSYNAIPFQTVTSPLAWLSAILNVGILGYGIYSLKTRNPIGYGILLYYGLLFIVSNILVNIGGYVAERFLSQPSLGFAIAVGILLYKGLERLPALTSQRLGLIASMTLLLLLGGAATIARNPEWKDNDTLFVTDAPKNPNSALINKACAGVYFAKSGRTKDEKKQRQYRDTAYIYFKKAYDIYPQYADALINLGSVHFLNKEYDKAAKYWKGLKDAWPTHPRLRENHDLILNQYLTIANDAFNTKDFETYLNYSKKALPFVPLGDEKVFLNVGLIYRDMGKFDSSAVYLRQVCQIQPNNTDYWITLALMEGKSNQLERARSALNQALRVNPNNITAKELLNQLPASGTNNNNNSNGIPPAAFKP